MWEFFSDAATKARAKRARSGYRFRPCVEVLESRFCPSGGKLQWCDPDVVNQADAVYSVLAQPSGKIVLVGSSSNTSTPTPHHLLGTSFTLAELDPNGSLDPNFGSGGIVLTPQTKGTDPSTAYAAVLYPTGGSGDEKILAVGSGNSTFVLVRYNANGSIDTSFGNVGYVGTNFKQGSGAGLVVLDGVVLVPNGTSLPKIVVAGSSSGGGGVELARYNPDGSLDLTFGSNGTVYTPISAGLNLHALALDPVSGDLIVAGSAVVVGGGLLAAFKSNGTLDTSFGQNGLVSTPGANPILYGLAVYPAADTSGEAGNILLAIAGTGVARYNVNGTLDTSWGGTGLVTAVGAEAVAIQPDDKVVASVNWSVSRLNTDGSLDSSFGNGGTSNSGLPSALPLNRPVTLLPNGDIVEAGVAHVPPAFAAVLYLPSEPDIGSFTANPNPVTSGTVTTLSASNLTDANPGATIAQVAFYIVINNTQTFLGYGTDSNGTWTYSFDTTGLAAGSYTLYAQATDSYGVLGNTLTLTLIVQ
jgi:uncharacterized delta-60 repeat protein